MPVSFSVGDGFCSVFREEFGCRAQGHISHHSFSKVTIRIRSTTIALKYLQSEANQPPQLSNGYNRGQISLYSSQTMTYNKGQISQRTLQLLQSGTDQPKQHSSSYSQGQISHHRLQIFNSSRQISHHSTPSLQQLQSRRNHPPQIYNSYNHGDISNYNQLQTRRYQQPQTLTITEISATTALQQLQPRRCYPPQLYNSYNHGDVSNHKY